MDFLLEIGKSIIRWGELQDKKFDENDFALSNIENIKLSTKNSRSSKSSKCRQQCL